MCMKVTCQDCGAMYRAPVEPSGRFFTCLRCGWPVRVPGEAPTERDPSLPPGKGDDDMEETVAIHRHAHREIMARAWSARPGDRRPMAGFAAARPSGQKGGRRPRRP
jgi:hypothetical protein